MKQYEKYKPSGVEWIGGIPSDWNFKKLKYCLNYITGFTPPTGREEFYNGEHTWVTIADMSQKIVKESSTQLSDKAIEQFSPDITPKDSLLYSFKLSVGKVAFAGKDLYTNEAIMSVLPNLENDLRFFYYSLPEQLLFNANENIYGAKLLNQELIRNASLLIPPKAEQTIIADYLDEKTAQIDTLIAKKQKLIDLLKEERTAIINKAVTRGINPDVKLKPSGIEWLGDIPKHWEVKRLKYVAERVQTGSTPPSNQEEYYEEQVNWFTPSDFSDSLRLTSSKRKISELAIKDGVAKLFPANSVLLVGIGATLGKVGYIEEPASSNQQINAIYFDRLEKATYYAYFLHVNQNNIVSLSNAATLAILNQSQTKDIPCIVPSSNEEIEEIIEFIEKIETVFITTISKIEKEIELLQEYRSALINEVVTGKIKVI